MGERLAGAACFDRQRQGAQRAGEVLTEGRLDLGNVAGPVTPPPGRLVRLGVVLPSNAQSALLVAKLCELAGIDVVWAEDEEQAASIRPTVSRLAVRVRPAVDETWAKTIAVSIGRTRIEAVARAALDPRLARFGEDSQAIGSLEECQAVVARLRAEGVTDLRCQLPDTPDIHDVIAQLTAIAFAKS